MSTRSALTPEQADRRRSLNKKILTFGCLPITVLLALVIVAAIAGSDDTDSKDREGKVTPPAYTVVKQDDSGNKRDIVVEVDHTTDLRAVFDDVTSNLTDEAGYYVMINCSTGGTAKVDNRLANGQHAIGNLGAATTGLDEGGSEFSVNEGRTCPKA